MKTGQIIKLCLIIIAIIYTQIANGQFHLNKEIHSIKIKSVSFDIFTPINEDCKSFEKFGKAIKVSEFKKKDDLNKIFLF